MKKEIVFLLLILSLVFLITYHDNEGPIYYGNYSELGSYGFFEEGDFGNNVIGCYDWEPCEIAYDFNSLTEEIINFQKRDCRNSNGEIIVQKKECVAPKSKIINNENNEVVLLRESSIEEVGELANILSGNSGSEDMGLTKLKISKKGKDLIVDIDIQI